MFIKFISIRDTEPKKALLYEHGLSKVSQFIMSRLRVNLGESSLKLSELFQYIFVLIAHIFEILIFLVEILNKEQEAVRALLNLLGFNPVEFEHTLHDVFIFIHFLLLVLDFHG